MTKLIPKEIFVLEKFSSPQYFAELRDLWGEMVKHLEQCLEEFMLNIPGDYRKRPLPQQPDIVWGERVLPNFRTTYTRLCSAFISIAHGDLGALAEASRPFNDYKGQRDYSTDWMTALDVARYCDLLNRANTIAGNICATEEPYWRPGDLADNLCDFGPISIPDVLPDYRLSLTKTVGTDEAVEYPGIYLPNSEASCAQFLGPDKEAPAAIVLRGKTDLLHPDTNMKYGEEPIFEDEPCIWTLVERMNIKTDRLPKSLIQPEAHRIESGAACPATGYYFTPAKEGSRRGFQKGEIMPDLESAYGATIWQWDSDQS